MGKQPEGQLQRGTFDNITYYVMGNKGYVRSKSSLTRKKVLKSKSFEKTRQCAAKMGRAAKIGSGIYRLMPGDIRHRWLYRAITGEAASMLYEGKEEQEIIDFLWKKYVEDTRAIPEDVIVPKRCSNVWPSTPETSKKLRQIFHERWLKQGKPNFLFKQAWDRRGYFNIWRFRDVVTSMQRPGR
jgi:hypothetical protein